LASRAAWQISCSERAAGVGGAVTFISRFLSRASGSGSEGQPPVFTHHGWPFSHGAADRNPGMTEARAGRVQGEMEIAE
jgi:hypothetical protein